MAGDIETPLHPRARAAHSARMIGEAYVRLGMDMSQAGEAFRLVGERALMLQYNMTQLNKPLSLITLSGV